MSNPQQKEIRARFGLIGSDLEIYENISILLDEENRIIEVSESPKDIQKNTVLLPGLVNSHVHAADIGLRGVSAHSLAELVGPGGIKHAHLNSRNPQEIRAAVIKSYEEAKRSGTLAWADFREGGIIGYDPYPVGPPSYQVYGRPDPSDFDQMEKLAPEFNIGVRDIIAYEVADLKKLVHLAKKQKRKVFIHASEDEALRDDLVLKFGKTDIELAIDMGIDSLVHVTHANEHDLSMMSKSNTGAIICYRSNRFTGAGKPPLASMMDLELVIGLGTDNAMFFPLSLWEEMHELFAQDVNPERIIRMATIDGAKLLGMEWGIERGNSNLLHINIPTHVDNARLVPWLVSKCTAKWISSVIVPTLTDYQSTS